MQHGFYFDADLCVKCHACEIACKTWNEVETGPRWREVVKVETGQFPDLKAMNVSIACMHCGDAPCRTACPVGAITKRSADGIVTVDPKVCIGCGFCAWACPFNAPQLVAGDGKMQKCNFCQTPGSERPLDMPRACEEVCPTGAIASGSLAKLANRNREKVAAKLGSQKGMQGFPGVVLDGAQRYGAAE